MQRILGISAYYHDSAAAIVDGNTIIAAAQEERFSRQKHDPRFPRYAIQYCLDEAGVSLSELDAVVFYDKPLLKFERLLETYLAYAPRGFSGFVRAMPIWLKQKLYLKQVLRRELRTLLKDNSQPLPTLLFTQHHQSHAASAYYPSPFSEAAVLCMDGVGEWATTSIWHGRGSEMTLLKELHFPHSLGLLYSAFTYYCGFKVNAGEYKLMGLSPYGQPRYTDVIWKYLVDLRDDGSFSLNLKYFDYAVGKTMINDAFCDLFGGPARAPEAPLDQRIMDIASSIQAVTEEIVVRLARHAREITGARYLCLAGGVALNCVANSKIRQAGVFDDLWVQPAAGDAGGALGAALAAFYLYHPDTPKPAYDSMKGAMLGPAFSTDACVRAAEEWGLPYVLLSREACVQEVAHRLTDGQVVGWFQGRMEFGPRALGNRSILGDARRPEMQRIMNVKIKQRESFRPFAPAALASCVERFFSPVIDNPYMLETTTIAPACRLTGDKLVGSVYDINAVRSNIPAVTHVDYSARLQVVDEKHHAEFAALLSAFGAITDMPLVINTSFNVRGEPPVCTPDDAIRCFLATEMDTLALGNILINKTDASKDAIERARKTEFAPD